jgi:type II secretory pathway pseudopilin PulG
MFHPSPTRWPWMARSTVIGDRAMPIHHKGPSTSTRKQSGVVLLTILLFVLLTTMAAGSMVQMYQTQTQRENEEQLLFVGDQYRKAISSYYNTIPSGSARSLPTSLDVLLNDQRFPTPVQHLRRIYQDPMTGTSEWSLVQQQGGIAGVYSRSEKIPFKTAGFMPIYKAFEGKTSYTDWKFVVKLN